MSIVKNSKKQLNSTYRRPDSSGDVEDDTHHGVQVHDHEHRRDQVCDESVRHSVRLLADSVLDIKCSRDEEVDQPVFEQHLH